MPHSPHSVELFTPLDHWGIAYATGLIIDIMNMGFVYFIIRRPHHSEKIKTPNYCAEIAENHDTDHRPPVVYAMIDRSMGPAILICKYNTASLAGPSTQRPPGMQ